MQTGRVLTGHYRGSRRRADRTCSVGVGEQHTLLGQPVDIGRLVQVATVAGHILPAEVIGKDENKIQSLSQLTACR